MRKPGSLLRAALFSGLLGLRAAAGDPAQPAPAGAGEIERLKKENARATRINELIARAQAASNGKKWTEAVELLQQLIAADSQQWEFRRSLGDALLNLGKYDEAIPAYVDGLSRMQPERAGAKPGR